MDRRNVRSLTFATMRRSWKGSLLRFDDFSTNKGLGTLGIQSLYRSRGTYCRHLSAEPSFCVVHYAFNDSKTFLAAYSHVWDPPEPSRQ
jgi:hypothetical protein